MCLLHVKTETIQIRFGNVICHTNLHLAHPKLT